MILEKTALSLQNQADSSRKDDVIGVQYTYRPPEQALVIIAFPDPHFLIQLGNFNHHKTKEIPEGTYVRWGSAKLDLCLQEDNASAWLKLFSFQIYSGVLKNKKKKKLDLKNKSKI